MTFKWSKMPFIYGSIYAAIPTLIYVYFDLNFTLPWQPISIIGIAVAFYLGFKNNSSYDRTWEARKIWGAIVNTSRSFGAAVKASVDISDEEEKSKIVRKIIYRHIAWLTALRFQLRLEREWEHKEDRVKKLFMANECTEYFTELDSHLSQYIDSDELSQYKNKSNIATQILSRQMNEITHLNTFGLLNDFRHNHLVELIDQCLAEQGKSERIKNFPFPRQYASTALWLNIVFSALLPFGLLSIFTEVNPALVWVTIPFNGLVTWVFFLMEKIGDYSENPFEGTYNDVPITSITRTIEIDLREMINDKDIPSAIGAKNGFLL